MPKFTVTTEEFDTAVKSLEDTFDRSDGAVKELVTSYADPFLHHKAFLQRGLRDHAELMLMYKIAPELCAATAAAVFLAWMAIGVQIGRAQVEKEQLGKLIGSEEG